jgi:cytochrome c-type biogenesis protein
MTNQTPRTHPASLYLLLLLAVVAVGLIGYTSYTLYPRFDLPAATGAGLLVLAVGAGAASFFSPCAFPLLVTLLAREAGAENGRNTWGRALRFAVALSVGATLFLLLMGAGIALGAAPIFESVTFTSEAGRLLRAGVGALLILLGLVQLGVLPSIGFGRIERAARPLQQQQARLRSRRPTLAFGLYGFGYVLAGFG